MEEIRSIVETLFGSGRDLATPQMVLRAIVVYPLALAMIRLGNKRFVGETAAFDFLLAIVIGSVLSRVISGNAPFWPSMAASFALILLHRILAMVAFRWHGFSVLIKGSPTVLVRDGAIQWREMRRSAVGEEDLHAALRLKASMEEIRSVRLASLERNGEISVIPAE